VVNYFRYSIKINPLIGTTYYSFGNTYYAANLEEKTIDEYRNSAGLGPSISPALFNVCPEAAPVSGISFARLAIDSAA
jgi:hypothetical protein